jgi:hypothetical protein
MLRALAVVSIGFAAFVSTVQAADNGVYLGAAVSQASVDVDLGSGPTQIPIDDEDTKFKLIAGFRPLDWLAFEVNYVDFGTIEGTAGGISGEYKLKGIDAFALGLFEIGLVDIYGKAGVIKWDQEVSISNVNIPAFDDDGFDPAYGVGLQVHFGSIGARLEYEMFDIGDADASMISLGLTWTFL